MENNQKNELQRLFAERLPTKLKQLARSLELLAQNNWPMTSVKTFAQLIDRIEKSCRNFNYIKAENAVGQLASLIDQVIKEQQAPSDAAVNEAVTSLTQLTEAITHELSGSTKQPAQDPPNAPSKPAITDSNADSEEEDDSEDLAHILREEYVYVITSDSETLAPLNEQLSHFGFQCRFFTDLETLNQAAKQNPPLAITAHIQQTRIDDDFAAKWQAFQIDTTATPLFVLSQHDSLELRLDGVRAGADGFFPAPFELSYLVECLEELSPPNLDRPYRLMIMEDSKAQAKYFSRIFRSAGIDVCTVNHPKDIAQALVDFQPELIVMDMLMPVCSGIELAKVIKQQEKYKNLPIVYLSANNDAVDKLEQLTIAGEDFLTKSIRSEQLLEAVQLRLRRARASAQRLASNSLTSLLSSAHFYRRLAEEVKRAHRDHTAFTLAVLNIEELQAINENYGYGTGDRVIKCLANLLRQRLRLSDVVGHYGKSDFAIILSECSLKDAKKVMKQLLEDFSALEYQHEQTTFSASFCYGLAEFVDHHNTAALQNTAQTALATAKNKRSQPDAIA